MTTPSKHEGGAGTSRFGTAWEIADPLDPESAHGPDAAAAAAQGSAEVDSGATADAGSASQPASAGGSGTGCEQAPAAEIDLRERRRSASTRFVTPWALESDDSTN